MDVSSPIPTDAQSSSMSNPRKRPAPIEHPCFDYNLKGECDAGDCVYLHECGICGKEGSLRLHPECLSKVSLTSSPSKKDTQDVAIGPDLDEPLPDLDLEESTVVPPTSASNDKDPKSEHIEDLVIPCGPATLTATEMAKDEAMTDAFLAAVKAGSLDTVRVFVKILQVDPSGGENAAIKWAAQLGHESVVELLLGDSRVDPSADGNYAIGIACKNGNDQVVKLLLQDSRVDAAADDNYSIRLASSKGHLTILNMLLDKVGVDPSAQENYAIRWASRNGHVHVVERLLCDARVDPSSKEDYAFGLAAQKGHVQVIKLLLKDERVDPAAKGNYALKQASKNGHEEIVRLILQDKRISMDAILLILSNMP